MAAILVPTMNRSDYVIRLLYFYADQKYQDTIYIGDAGNQTHVKKTLSAIDALKGQLKIVYKHLPRVNIQCTKKELMKEVKETYVTFAGDDDFVLPKSIKKAEDFLNCNPDYSTCHGKPVLFTMDQNNGISGRIQSVVPYHLLESAFDSPLERIENFLDQYWVSIFSVHRSEEFQEDLKDMNKIPLECFREITLSSLSIIQGKSKRLDSLYLMRQLHGGRYLNPSILELMIKPTWHPSFMAFHDILVEALIKYDEVLPDIASETIKNGYWIYFSKGVKKTTPMEETQLENLRKYLRDHLSILSNILKRARSKISEVKQGTSLPGFLNTASPHHSEFMSVYKFLHEYRYSNTEI